MNPHEITNFLNAALECSVFHAPTEPGLTYDEIVEVGNGVGLQRGEITDALGRMRTQRTSKNRYLPDDTTMMMWGIFAMPEEPDYRDLAAFDFVTEELNTRVRADGEQAAQLDRAVMIERAISRLIPRSAIESSIAILVLSGQLVEKNNLLRFKHGGVRTQLPSEQQGQTSALNRRPRPMPERSRANPLVKDIIARRADGRPKHAEPLDAFAEELEKLGYGSFRLWWTQTVAELRRCDINVSPLSVSVLAAALVEGALTFVVRHARNLKLGVLGSTNFERPANTWKIDDLVSSAAAGGETAILDANAKVRADGLIRTRQRIHAGRMLVDFPRGVPDLRPEEAREARATADLVVRRVVDWLQNYPPIR